MSFTQNCVSNFSYLSAPLSATTWLHAFLGAPHDFNRPEVAAEFCNTVGLRRLFLPTQVHGNIVVPLEHELPITITADGLFFRPADFKNVGIGVRTADCLPVILSTEDFVAIVHAGWRGVASEIIPAAIAQFTKQGVVGTAISVAIGPCAGPRNYEVGNEVVDALNAYGVFERITEQKVLLDLAATAKNQCIAYGVRSENIFTADICTIDDRSFFSHRRHVAQKIEGKRGNNLTVVWSR